MHKAVTIAFAVAMLSMTSGAAASAAQRSDTSINKEVEAYIVAHPMDFVGIDKLVSKYTGEHVLVGSAEPGSTNLGTLRSVQPALGVVWNISDYVSGFQDMADRGTTRVEVRRGSGCPPTVQVGAAFDYEANRGGSVLSVGLSFGFFTVSYNGFDLTPLHLGTEPIYFNI